MSDQTYLNFVIGQIVVYFCLFVHYVAVKVSELPIELHTVLSFSTHCTHQPSPLPIDDM